jgi:hypothetical protein
VSLCRETCPEGAVVLRSGASTAPVRSHQVSNMSEELATVVAIDGNHAWVECERRSACSGCHQQSSCGTGTVAKAFPMKAQRLRVALTIDVSGGPASEARHPQASILQGRRWSTCCRCSVCWRSPAGATLAGSLAVGRGGGHHPQLPAGRRLSDFHWFVTFPTGSIRGLWSPHAGCGPAHPPPLLTLSRPVFLVLRRLKIGRRPGYPVKSCLHIRP